MLAAITVNLPTKERLKSMFANVKNVLSNCTKNISLKPSLSSLNVNKSLK